MFIKDGYRCSVSSVIEHEVSNAEDYYSRGADAVAQRHNRLVELVGLLVESLPSEVQKEFVSKLHGWRFVE